MNVTTDRLNGVRTREAWLGAFVEAVRPWFQGAGRPLPEAVSVSVGWPSKRALSRRKRVLGECWEKHAARDGNPAVFVSPLLEEAEVPHVLLHELAHAATPGAGHKGPFVVLIRQLGLEGRPTATVAGADLRGRLADVAKALGPYPHGVLDVALAPERKDGTRLKKLTCSCGRILRATRLVATLGPITCGVCFHAFVVAA